MHFGPFYVVDLLLMVVTALVVVLLSRLLNNVDEKKDIGTAKRLYGGLNVSGSLFLIMSILYHPDNSVNELFNVIYLNPALIRMVFVTSMYIIVLGWIDRAYEDYVQPKNVEEDSTQSEE